MPYVTAVFDRTQTDIDTRTSKAFLNIADWDRIEDNAVYVRGELVSTTGITIIFTSTTSAPAITSIPDVDDFNRLLENIEQLRQAAEDVMPALTTISGFSVVAHDWIAGVSQNAPDYTDVNHWEEVIDIIYQTFLDYYVAFDIRYPRCGIAMSNSGTTWNNRFRA